LNINILQSHVVTNFRRRGRFYFTFSSVSENARVKINCFSFAEVIMKHCFGCLALGVYYVISHSDNDFWTHF